MSPDSHPVCRAAAIRQHGEHEVKLRNHTSTTRVSANLDAIFKQSLQGSARASALYHQIQEASAAEKEKLIQIAVRGALLHQETHLEKFLECERLGRPLPNVFPDPRDVFIEDDGVRIVGPVTLADKLRDDQLLADRENIVECWLENEQMGASADYIRKEKRKLNKFYKLIEEDLSIKHRMPLDLIIRKIRQKHKKEDARYAAEDKEADD